MERVGLTIIIIALLALFVAVTLRAQEVREDFERFENMSPDQLSSFEVQPLYINKRTNIVKIIIRHPKASNIQLEVKDSEFIRHEGEILKDGRVEGLNGFGIYFFDVKFDKLPDTVIARYKIIKSNNR